MPTHHFKKCPRTFKVKFKENSIPTIAGKYGDNSRTFAVELQVYPAKCHETEAYRLPKRGGLSFQDLIASRYIVLMLYSLSCTCIPEITQPYAFMLLCVASSRKQEVMDASYWEQELSFKWETTRQPSDIWRSHSLLKRSRRKMLTSLQV